MQMMKAVLGITIVLLSGLPLLAQVDIYTKADIQAFERTLKPHGPVSADKALGHYNNHHFLIAKREATGSSELHQHEADVFVVESGEAVIQTGGEMVGGHATSAGEIRGTSIKGGEQHALSAGDVVHIPAGVPHRLLLTKGKPFTYFVIKVAGQ